MKKERGFEESSGAFRVFVSSRNTFFCDDYSVFCSNGIYFEQIPGFQGGVTFLNYLG